MNRNQMNRFAIAPTDIDIGRSIFNRDHSVKFSFDCGQLIPFLKEEVLPGDTWTTSTSKVVRVQPLVTPVMDNLYLDTYYFFVPNRLIWTHWKQFMGENTESAWVPSTTYTIPTITPPQPSTISSDTNYGWNVGTIADYLGIPPLNITGIASGNASQLIRYNALPFRAVALICDQWFRDENLMQPLNIYTGDTNVTGSNGNDPVTDVAKGGQPFVVAKYHDYFTSALPAPQKGPSVTAPINGVGSYGLPVYSANGNIFDALSDAGVSNPNVFTSADPFVYPLRWNAASGSLNWGLPDRFDSSNSKVININPADGQSNLNNSSAAASGIVSTPANLFAYVSNGLSIDVSSLRTAFAVQRYYERLSRSGSRYTEMIKSFFGVTSPDSRLQRAEYLGGNRVPLNISQVENVTNTSSNIDPIGSVAGMSVTGDTNSDFQYSATEHGYIIGLCCVRFNHTYQQGVEKDFLRRTVFDYYNPVFANLSEMPITKRQIYDVYAPGDAGPLNGNKRDEVFGYQEAWAEYRYKPSRVCGQMRSVYAQSLDVWHFADNYSSVPSLSPDWIREDKALLDRSLAVTSDVSNQIIADFYIQSKVSRPMPVYSIPGLIDHH